MQYLHSEVEAKAGDTVEISLDGNAANVQLLDSGNFIAYQQGRSFRYYGGHTTKSPVRITAPRTGKWHVVIDLGGLAGKVKASVRVIAAGGA